MSARKIGVHSLQFDMRPYQARSSGGTPYTRWMAVGMPRIPQNTAKCVVFLYESKEDALKRENPQGTAFIVAAPSSVSNHVAHAHFYVIANWHVAVSPKNQEPPACVVCLNFKDGSPDAVELDPVLDWQFEPGGDDIAIAPIEIDINKHDFTCIPLEMFATKQWVHEHQVGFGDDIFMLGLFVDETGIATRLPKARFGNISAMPSPHTAIEQENDSKHPSIVIDMHSRGGHSGSPVFVYRTQGSNLDDANTSNITLQAGPLGGTLFKFFGVHWGQFPETLELKSGEEVEGWSGMTCAIPAWRLEGVLNLPEIKRRRGMREKEQANKPAIRNAPRGERATAISPESPSSGEIAAPRANDANPTHREDFTRLLGAAVRTPPQED